MEEEQNNDEMATADTGEEEQGGGALQQSDSINLGPSIELSGFRELEPGAMPVIKKIVGHSVRVISEKAPKFERIKLTLKKVHAGHGQFELHALAIVDGNSVTSEAINRNLYFGLSEILQKIEHQVSSQQ